ncbi:MAG: hypothetical protein AB1384_11335 [Actinomycetota bacterium]
MKRVLLISLLALFLAVALMAVGCGGSDGGKNGEEGPAGVGSPNAGGGSGEQARFNAVGTFESPDGKSIVLEEDGTFESDAWGTAVSGTYLCSDDELGKWVDLAFEDGSSVSLSVMTGNDEVAAIVDNDTGIQYTKK